MRPGSSSPSARNHIPSGTQRTSEQIFESLDITAAVKPIVVPASEHNLYR